jgi:hypothetical protein
MSATQMTNDAIRTTLVALMVLGGLALWIGVPAGILWGLGEMTDTKSQHLLLGLLAVPIGMALCGVVLAFLNRAYMRRTGIEGSWANGPLDGIVVACAAAALVAFAVWMVFGTEGVAPLW